MGGLRMLEKLLYVLVVCFLFILQLTERIGVNVLFISLGIIGFVIWFRILIFKKYDLILLLINPTIDNEQNKRIVYVSLVLLFAASLLLLGFGFYKSIN